MEFNEKRFTRALDEMFVEIKTVLILKGKQYGHEVQRISGPEGNIYRLMDKVFRLKNMLIDNPGMADPEDSWLDLLGYAFLGILNSRGYFEESFGKSDKQLQKERKDIDTEI